MNFSNKREEEHLEMLVNKLKSAENYLGRAKVYEEINNIISPHIEKIYEDVLTSFFESLAPVSAPCKNIDISKKDAWREIVNDRFYK